MNLQKYPSGDVYASSGVKRYYWHILLRATNSIGLNSNWTNKFFEFY